MAHWRKIDTRIWADEKFRSLTDQGKLLFLYVLTHPNMTCRGAMRATVDGLAAELGWEGGATRGAINSTVEKGMLVVDEFAHFVGAPNWFKYNPPERPFGLEKLWRGALDKIPECTSKKEQILRSIQCLDDLGEKMRTAIGGGTRRAMVGAIQGATGGGVEVIEREPEQEQERDQFTLPLGFPSGPEQQETTTGTESQQPPVLEDAPRKPRNGHSRKKNGKGSEDEGPIPFTVSVALRTLTERCQRVVPPANFDGYHAKQVTKLIRAFPSLETWQLVGEWLAAGGVAYMSFIGLDCLRKNFGTWVPVSEVWRREGRKPLTKRAAESARGLSVGDA